VPVEAAVFDGVPAPTTASRWGMPPDGTAAPNGPPRDLAWAARVPAGEGPHHHDVGAVGGGRGVSPPIPPLAAPPPSQRHHSPLPKGNGEGSGVGGPQRAPALPKAPPVAASPFGGVSIQGMPPRRKGRGEVTGGDPAGIRALVVGAWWLKWVDERDPVRLRWVWVDRRRWCLYWAKTEDTRAFPSGAMRLLELDGVHRFTFEQYSDKS